MARMRPRQREIAHRERAFQLLAPHLVGAPRPHRGAWRARPRARCARIPPAPPCSVRSSRMGPSLLCASMRQAMRTSDCNGPLSRRIRSGKPRALGLRDGVVVAGGQIDASLPDERCRLAAGAPAIHQRGRQCRAADAVAAVDAARGLAGGEQAIDRGLAVDVDLEAAEPGVASRRHLQRRLADVDAAVQAGLVDVRDLLLDHLHRHLGRVHENAAGGGGAPGVDFLGHGQDHLGTGRLLRRVGEIALEKLLALLISEHRARVDEAGRMRREAEQLLGRAAHRLEVDHLDAEERHAGAESQHVAVARHLRRVVVDVEQPAAAAGAQDDLLRVVDDERAVLVVDAPGADHAAVALDEIDDGRDRMLLDARIGAQLLRQHLGDHVAGGVVVMAGPVSGVAREMP